MKSPAITESVAILARFTAATLATGFTGAGEKGADVRRACGTLDASAEAALTRGEVASLVHACLHMARFAGATLEGMGRVRNALADEDPVYAVGQAVVAGSIRLCLSQEARILAAATLVSRDDVDRYTARMNDAFAGAEEIAADAGETGVYRALAALHAAVTRDLTTRARPLPRMVSYRLPTSIPALALANRFYGDADRADDLIQENRVVHPLFMPLAGRALSA